jgi:hypothetical protein
MDNTTQFVEDALDVNPEMRLVLELAARAREIEQRAPPINLWVNTEVVSSQYPVSQATQS